MLQPQNLAFLFGAVRGWLVAGLFCCGLCLSAAAQAQTNAFWTPGSGDWFDGSLWDIEEVPNNNGSDFFNVFIDGDPFGFSSVTIQSFQQVAVDSLTVGAGDQLFLSDNTGLRIDWDPGRAQSGMVLNDGNIFLNSGVSAADLNIESEVTLSGTGNIMLTSANSRIFDEVGTPDGHLINVGNHIQGQGFLGLNRMRLTNQAAGIINANINGGTLVVDTHDDGSSNAGYLTAVNGGILELRGLKNFDNTGGVIQALDGSQVRFTGGSDIRGGRLQRGGLGELVAPTIESVTLRDLEINGVFRVEANANLALDGDINNRANLLVNNGDIQIQSDTQLSGPGIITLQNSASRILQEGNGNGHLTNSQLIEGQGTMAALRLTNLSGGIIDANVNGGLLRIGQLKGGFDLVNEGILRATGGGTLQIDGITSGVLQNTTSEIQAHDGSLVRLASNLTIEGGTLRAFGSGSFEIDDWSTAQLNDVVLDSNLLADLSNVQISGSLENRRSITLAANGQVFILDPVVLDGGGSIDMTHATTRISNVGSANLGELTNVDNLIHGQGRILTRMINQSEGVVDADVNGAALTWDTFWNGSAFNPVNDGIFQASNGGILEVVRYNSFTGTFFNQDGVIQALDNSEVVFGNGLHVNGGQIRTEGTGQLSIRPFNTITLTDVTLDGPLEADSSALQLIGTLENRQTIRADNSGAIVVMGNVNLIGGGEVVLEHANVDIRQAGSQPGHLINVDNTIRGQGDITARLTNGAGGLIRADVHGTSLFFDTAGGFDLINQGLMEATGGGILHVDGIANGSGFLNNQGGGVVQALDGSVVLFTSGLKVTGGTLRTEGSGEIRVQANNQFRFADLTIDGQVNVVENGSLFLDGDIVNLGNTINVDGATSSSTIQITVDTTLSGGGTIQLDGPNAKIIRGSFQGQAIGNLVNVDNTIVGQGQLGDGGIIFTNQIDGVVHSNVAGQTLAIDAQNQLPGSVTATNNGLFRASAGGTLLLAGSGGGEYGGSGTFEALNNSAMQFDAQAVLQSINAGGTLTEGTWRAVDSGAGALIDIANANTPPLTTIGPAAQVELSGVASAMNIAGTAIDDSLLVNLGGLTLRDGRIMNTSASLANSGNLLIDGAATRLNIAGDLVQQGGETRLRDGSVVSAVQHHFQGGTLSGNGTVEGDALFQAASILSPGESPGILLFEDATTIAGMISVELEGLLVDGASQNAAIVNSGLDFDLIEFDQINILGTGELLDGTVVNVTMLQQFAPPSGAFFDVLTADELLVGDIDLLSPQNWLVDFDVLTLPDLTYGGTRDVLRLNVTSVPEPNSLLILALTVVALVAWRRKPRWGLVGSVVDGPAS